MNEIDVNQTLYKFAEQLNMDVFELMKTYDSHNPDSERTLQKIKNRVDILIPIRDMQLKEQQIAVAKEIQNGEFMKNFNLKDLIGALKG